ncbi:hypothetical protein K493DRAFT_341021 [Basidiobolus meristosporus CBS 931.73]|uniref:Serpin domain-containing protein n=1 Tax=Basidiobolus meristosporus CBS 931.73 TaxID=1314790 RepID=A0A1Y1XTP8_9FUNG|nr:hypothetical protein K493DRAFT_341021 [Basidiobolus meristosporus CBS 931.73]|eukprot:ORX88876.1 hypothetical protein K493DRAFT_341021 [Basidiobolus meristosporus CBS 931.73]
MNANSTVQELVTSLGMNMLGSFQQDHAVDTNLMFSPFSIFSALFMFMYASYDKSQAVQELLQLFGLYKPKDKQNIHVYTLFFKTYFYDLIDKFDEVPVSANQTKADLILANSLWGRDIKKSFSNLVRRELLCDTFNQVPSPHGVETWLRKTTGGKLTGIIQKDATFRKDDLLLTSTLHFAAGWANPFLPGNRKVERFNAPNGKFFNSIMMSQVDQTYPYYENNKYQLLDMDFDDQRFTATFILPKSTMALHEFHQMMSPWDWSNALKKNRWRHRINVNIPKFKLDARLNLRPYLERAKVTTIFNPATVFPYLSSKPKTLPAYLHQAHMEIIERGMATN